METTITPALDSFETRLPPVSRRVVRLNRTLTGASIDTFRRAGRSLLDAGKAVSKSAVTGTKTVTGQASSVVRRVAATTNGGVREVTGQARAQTVRTLDVAEQQAASLLEQTEEAVADASAGSYDSWTKTELYARAQELDIDGRSTMDKQQLVSALQSI
jgi:hypothetical protein